MSVTNDGHCILLADQKSRLLLVDKSTGQLLNTFVCFIFIGVCALRVYVKRESVSQISIGRYRGHVSNEFRVECSVCPGDRHLVAGSEDGALHFWDLLSVRFASH